jgi:hypothetical protein
MCKSRTDEASSWGRAFLWALHSDLLLPEQQFSLCQAWVREHPSSCR